MTPRTDIDGCDIESSAQDVAKMIDETGHTRIPIYQGSIDRIVGVIHAKDLLKTLMMGNGSDIRELMRAPLFIPESKDLHGLLQEFRKERSLMAIVQDEFGGTAGLVTMEDLVEEIVGQIVDEYDVEEPEVQPIEEGRWLIDGRMHLDDVNDEIGADFESEEFDTLGGYVFGLCGRQPEEGDEVEDDDWSLRVAATDGRRVVRVMATRREPVA
jgi:CBS domain containing-hemolysin-like protein